MGDDTFRNTLAPDRATPGAEARPGIEACGEAVGLVALRGGIISEADFAKEQGCCRESVRRAIRAGRLPQSILLPGGRGWLRDVLFDFLKKRHEAAQIEAQTNAAQISEKISRLST